MSSAFGILSNITFTVYVAPEKGNLDYFPSSAANARLERNILPANAQYTGALVDIWNMMSEVGGFSYIVAGSPGFTPGLNIVAASMEPNVITLGSHWLNAGRAASPAHHTVSLGTYAVTQGVRLRSMLPAETFFSRALVVF